MTDQTVTFRVRRHQPGQEDAWQEYPVAVHPGMTVLDGLQQIKEQQDSSLAWRHSCRMGICGSCGMVINGQPGLACNTQVLDISDRRISLEPLSNFPVARDLVPDLEPMFDKHRSIKPFLIAGQQDGDEPLRQSPRQLTDYLQFSYCIKCGACMAACPTLASDADFLGPMPLTAAHRYNRDSRDDGFDQRKQSLGDHHSISHCHYAAECSKVCPKGVDPAKAIQYLKRDLVLDLVGLRRRPGPVPQGSPGTPRDDIPKAPEFTVKKP
ncbi:MAG: succinate dehydrogenase/fumarate reductase iron-sulfur subunit [Xanthomonadales bacterium]|nr:succinate dehydrogenase/fumarate reductase iron-sulfur subunit [Xanthomonadales bacterium]